MAAQFDWDHRTWDQPQLSYKMSCEKAKAGLSKQVAENQFGDI